MGETSPIPQVALDLVLLIVVIRDALSQSATGEHPV